MQLFMRFGVPKAAFSPHFFSIFDVVLWTWFYCHKHRENLMETPPFHIKWPNFPFPLTWQQLSLSGYFSAIKTPFVWGHESNMYANAENWEKEKSNSYSSNHHNRPYEGWFRFRHRHHVGVNSALLILPLAKIGAFLSTEENYAQYQFQSHLVSAGRAHIDGWNSGFEALLSWCHA